MTPAQLKGVSIGAGYFSQYHFDAWNRIPEVTITALCDVDRARAEEQMNIFGIERYYSDFREMIDTERPDFVDIITPPRPTWRSVDTLPRTAATFCARNRWLPRWKTAGRLSKWPLQTRCVSWLTRTGAGSPGTGKLKR